MSSIRRPKHAENPSENIKVFENISLKLSEFNSVTIRCKIGAGSTDLLGDRVS